MSSRNLEGNIGFENAEKLSVKFGKRISNELGHSDEMNNQRLKCINLI